MRKKNGNTESEKLVRVLTAHFKALVEAQSDEALLTEYSALLRFLRSRRSDFFHPRARDPHPNPKARKTPLSAASREKLQDASLDELERLVNDDRTSRRHLEAIAIQRFSVPSGSMRSFSNRQMLVEKLRSLISSERTHDTIGTVARGQARLISEY